MSDQTAESRSSVRNQHYVPRCLLKAFAKKGNGKKPQICVFDKANERSYVAATENVFAMRDFNTFEGTGGFVLCLEDGMAKIEDQAAPVLREIIETQSLAGLNDVKRAALLTFVALQKVRGVSPRAQMDQMVEGLKRRIQADGSDPDKVLQLKETGDEQTKLAALQLIRESLGEFTLLFAGKALMLHKAAKDTEFLIGDTPVVWANERKTAPYGNLGLAVLGIEIYMPISPQLCLAFWCPTIVQMIRDGIQHAKTTVQDLEKHLVIGAPAVAEQAAAAIGKARGLIQGGQRDLESIETGRPLHLSADNMLRANSLQVAQSARFVASQSGDFSFPIKMLKDNSAYRVGPRHDLVGP